jgi:hypothetical protein
LVRRFQVIHPLGLMLLALAAALLPFCGKAVHIDDPLYLWTAEHLLSDGWGQVFNFSVNWSGTMTPMAEAVFNPPGTAYYLALVVRLFGWNEVTLHLAFFLVALIAAAGIFVLARAWCQTPALATALAISTPIFLLSATTLMSDVPMLMFWVWALVFWEKGTQGWVGGFLIAGFLTGLATVTKYNGILLLPLFAIGVCYSRKNWLWMLAGCLVPLLMLGGYEYATAQIHGRGLFSLTRELSAEKRQMIATNSFHLPYQFITLLTFLGGGAVAMSSAAAINGFKSRKSLLLSAAAVGVVILAVCVSRDTLGPVSLAEAGVVRWGLVLQIVLWAVGGALLVIQTGTILFQTRDRVTVMLVAWVAMGIGYAVFLNWMISGRGLLWIIPALAILVARQFERVTGPAWLRWVPVGISGPVALLVTMADAQFAASARAAARQISAKYVAPPDGQLWFQGHWGFQYYLQRAGWLPMDFAQANTKIGDWVATPYNNVKILLLPDEYVAAVEEWPVSTCSWVATQHPDTGAAFHANQLGPLPFYFGPVPPESYQVQRLAKSIPALR